MSNYKNVSKEQVEGVFADESKRQEAASILKDEDKAESFVRKINKKLENIPFVGSYFADVPTLCLMVTDYVKGTYKEVPFATMIGIVVALAYFLSPVDLIPDVVPFVGQMDDAAVILFAVNSAHNDIAEYKEWKGL